MPPDRKKRTPEAELRSYIERSDPKEQKLIRSIRAAVRKRLPTANELAYDYGKFILISYSPTDRGIDSIVSIAARADGVRMYFMHGPQLPDPKGLLKGSGKQARFVGVTAARELAHPDVEALIAAAIEKAKVALPSRGKGTLIIRGRGAKEPARPSGRGRSGTSLERTRGR